MLMMRLQRIGRRNEPHYKIVVIEKTKGPKSQKYVDILGSYNPKKGEVILKEELAKDWIEKGVQPSDTVYNMLVAKGILEGQKKNVLPKKSPTKKKNAPEEPEAKEAPAEEETPVEESSEESSAEAPAEESVPEAETPEQKEETVEAPSPEKLEEAEEQAPEVPAEETKA